ncbi:MAG: CoA transferase subunit A [Thermocladium sp.]
MTNKLVDLNYAIELINDGDWITIGGMSFHRNPMAFAKALGSSNRRNLRLLDREPGLAFDLLILSGKVDEVRMAMASFERFGIAPAFRIFAEAGKLRVKEDVCEAIMAGLRAGAFGLPFMVSSVDLRSNIVKMHLDDNTWGLTRDPFTGKDVLVVKAIEPDVAVIHVHNADAEGNAELVGPKYEDLLKVYASKKVIITAEQIVNEDYFKKDPSRLTIPGIKVNAVIELPRGAYPTSMYGLYKANYDAIKSYYESVRSGINYNDAVKIL